MLRASLGVHVVEAGYLDRAFEFGMGTPYSQLAITWLVHTHEYEFEWPTFDGHEGTRTRARARSQLAVGDSRLAAASNTTFASRRSMHTKCFGPSRWVSRSTSATCELFPGARASFPFRSKPVLRNEP